MSHAIQERAKTLADCQRASYEKIMKGNCQALKVLDLQVFSSTMIETLVNDLMDLAKFESNNFRFDDKFFNPVLVIRNAFQVLIG